MQTYTGRKFWPLDPDPNDVCVKDIAHSLGLLCRFGGHVDRFYSVAEHCLLVSYAVAPENALHGLLHDATEAYVGDMIRPLKQSMPFFREVESLVWYAIAEHFRISSAIPDEVRDIDLRMLLNERAALMPRTRYTWGVDNLSPVEFLDKRYRVRGLNPRSAIWGYERRLEQLLEERDGRSHSCTA